MNTFWQIFLCVLGGVWAIETVFTVIFVWIPLMRWKRQEKRRKGGGNHEPGTAD